MRKDFRNRFHVEPLEQRVLLSADPVSGGVMSGLLLGDYILRVNDQSIVNAPLNSSADTLQPSSGAVIDIAKISPSGSLDTAFIVPDGMTLKGSGVTGFDQLNITGAATLAGTLNVSLLGGFTPEVGDAFDIITFGWLKSGTPSYLHIHSHPGPEGDPASFALDTVTVGR